MNLKLLAVLIYWITPEANNLIPRLYLHSANLFIIFCYIWQVSIKLYGLCKFNSTSNPQETIFD